MTRVSQHVAREYVDFSPAGIPPHQRNMDVRLFNWARWCRNRQAPQVAPGFNLHKSDEWERREYGSNTSVATDRIDASRIAKGVSALPEKNRVALQWFYLNGRHPIDKARALAVSVRGLRELVNDARQMLINRGV